MFFLVLLYTVILNFVHRYAYAEKECKTPTSHCSTSLVPTSHGQSHFGSNSTRIPLLETTSPSQQRSSFSQQDQSSNGILRRPMALQILHEDGESNSRHMWWMLGNVDDVPRPYLRAQATAKTRTPGTRSSNCTTISGLCRRLVRHSMERFRKLMAPTQQVTKEENTIATSTERQQTFQFQTNAMENRAPRTCRRQGSREGQAAGKRRGCGRWALAALHYLDFTSGSAV